MGKYCTWIHYTYNNPNILALGLADVYCVFQQKWTMYTIIGVQHGKLSNIILTKVTIA